MKVTLKRNFNAPDDHLFYPRNNPNQMDDDLLPYLPSDAVIVGKTRDETRLAVLKARKAAGLDKPSTATESGVRLTSDEDLLKGELDKTQKKDDAPKEPTKAELEKQLEAAVKRLAAAKKALDAAKTEPDKGVAKQEFEKAEADVAGLEALIEDAE